MKSVVFKIFHIFTIIITTVVLLFSLCHVRESAGHCPFMTGHESICTMSSMEDIQAWQNLFVAFPLRDMVLLVSVLLILLYTLGFHKIKKFSYDIYTKLASLYKKIITPLNPLKEAFADGILNPKTF